MSTISAISNLPKFRRYIIMANTKHAVVRIDKLGGTLDGAQLESAIFYKESMPLRSIMLSWLFWARSWVVRSTRLPLLPQLPPSLICI